MSDINRILVPVDLEHNTGKLVDFAIDMANIFDAEIVLFHGVQSNKGGTMADMGQLASAGLSDEQLSSTRVDEAGKKLEELAGEADGRCKKCDSRVVAGDVVDDIVEFAQQQHADLIIIGTHGKRGLEHILLGSVAERVIKRSPCPTLVMNPYRQPAKSS